MLLRILVGRLVLLGEDEEILDAKYLRLVENINQGDEVCFACHDVIVGERLDCDRGGALMLLQGNRSSVSQIQAEAQVTKVDR
jgi:hypothetical protein